MTDWAISLWQTLYSITEVKTCLITHCLPSLGSALVLNPLYRWGLFTHQERFLNKVQCHKSNSAQYLHVDYCQQSLLRVCVTWTMLKLGFDSLLNEFWSHSGLFFDEREGLLLIVLPSHSRFVCLRRAAKNSWVAFFFFLFLSSLKQSSLWDFVVDCSSVCPNPNCNGNMVHDFWFWTCVKVSSCDNASWGICLSEQSCCTCFSFSLPLDKPFQFLLCAFCIKHSRGSNNCHH